jgi:putative PIN family toxin of toxin-antitoxin system
MAGRCRCLVDDNALAELRRVLAYPEFALDAEAQSSIWNQYRALAEPVAVGGFCRKLPRCRDPDDQPFLVLAAAGAADFLVSKDRALLEMNRRGGLGFAIVSPDEACRHLGLQADPRCHIGVNRV